MSWRALPKRERGELSLGALVGRSPEQRAWRDLLRRARVGSFLRQRAWELSPAACVGNSPKQRAVGSSLQAACHGEISLARAWRALSSSERGELSRAARVGRSPEQRPWGDLSRRARGELSRAVSRGELSLAACVGSSARARGEFSLDASSVFRPNRQSVEDFLNVNDLPDAPPENTGDNIRPPHNDPLDRQVPAVSNDQVAGGGGGRRPQSPPAVRQRNGRRNAEIERAPQRIGARIPISRR